MAILYEKKDKIAIITINRPEAMNAIDPETTEELGKAWLDFRDDPDRWVGILTGAGDKAFSAGADLKKLIPFLAKLSPLARREREEKFPGLGGITRGLNIWKPIIAAINGFCLAGGLEMALACDLRVAADHATFGLLEVSRGIIPGAGGTQRLPRMIPMAKAMEIILMAQRIDAQEALRLGLVNRVVPLPEVMPTAMKMAEAILQNGPLAVRAAKEAIIRGLSMTLEEGLRLESVLQSYLLVTEDAIEGPRAFAEKRKPQYKAR
ncbi:MAG: enoyl-CoA hydratase-related protein [Thermodesulfobacteriota bacterium]|jgi:enoyl-CoA hydratase/carnithine racemase